MRLPGSCAGILREREYEVCELRILDAISLNFFLTSFMSFTLYTHVESEARLLKSFSKRTSSDTSLPLIPIEYEVNGIPSIYILPIRLLTACKYSAEDVKFLFILHEPTSNPSVNTTRVTSASLFGIGDSSKLSNAL